MPKKITNLPSKINISQTCKQWGIGLIIAGILSFVFSNTFSTAFGIFAIFLGVFALAFRAKWVMLLIGIVVVLVGVWNIISVLIIRDYYWFTILGILQIFIGIGALNEYHKHSQ